MHVPSLPLWILQKLLTRFGILPSFLNSSALFCQINTISRIAVRKSASVISIVVLSVTEEEYPKVQFLDQFSSLYLSIIFPPFSLHLLRFCSMQMTLPFGPPPQVLSVQLPQHKLPSTDWWNGPPRGAFLSTHSNVNPFSSAYQSRIKPSLYILNSPLNFNPYPTFLGVTFNGTLSFKYYVLSLRKNFHSRFRAFRSIVSASWGPSKKSLCTLYKAFICPILTYASSRLVSFHTS